MKTQDTAVLERPSTPPPPVQTSAPKPAGGLKRISFGAVVPKKEEGKTKYPVFNDPTGECHVIAERIKKRKDELDALEGALKTDKAELRMRVTRFYFESNRGKHEVPSSISIPSPAGEVLVTYQNRYTKLKFEDAEGGAVDPVAPIAAILGESMDKYFQQAFKLTIDGALLPTDKAQGIVDELLAVLGKHGAMEAVKVDEELKPTKEFHAARHLELTPEQNLALEEAAPIIAMIKTKGREKK